ncbi:MAG: hypothetical protein FJ194_08215 [Gammaproteobacteria bacterium]|nr:hypothetical protein [Gammaproteobacteria bacterium]
MNPMNRRHFLGICAAGSLTALAGCANPLPLAGTPPARNDSLAARWLGESADQHGWLRFQTLNDINVA